jgi:aromatic-L-amino-acid decarboxylase
VSWLNVKGMMDKLNNGTLSLTQDQMRELGYRVIDVLVEHFNELRNKPVTSVAERAELERRLREPLPSEASDSLSVLSQIQEDVFSNIMHLDHPRFFAFVPSPNNFVSVMADALASGFNVFAGTWLEASGPAEIELVTIDWLRELYLLPATAGGLFVSGGSMANITALAVARHIKLRDRGDNAVIYCSDQTHSSIERGLRVLGFAPAQLRKLPSDENFRLSVSALSHAVNADRAAGQTPFCVVANAGTTNTGAIDPLVELADFCAEENLWLHADGAYGAAGILCEEGLSRLSGIDRVDSLALDPHKWLFQPFEIGCVLVRDSRWLKGTFHILPEYLKDIERAEEEVNFCDYGIQLTRSFKALKLWMSLKVFGLKEFAKAVEHGFKMAEAAENYISGLPSWSIVTPAQMGIITFSYTPGGISPSDVNQFNERLVTEMIADGFALVSTTTLRGKVVLRLCTINPRTTEMDIRETIDRLDSFAKKLEAIRHPRGA